MNTPSTPRKRGPVPDHGETMIPLAIRLPPTLVERIDAISASQLDRPNRTTLIRALIVEGLLARERGS